MKKVQSIKQLKQENQQLNEQEMTKTKGGWLVTCEEKQGLLGKYTAYKWNWDGSLKVTMMT